MKKSHLLTVAAAAGLLVLGVAMSGVFAQGRTNTGSAGYQQARPTATPVALIDISKVFKDHNRFNSNMNAMKARVQAAEEQMKKDAETLKGWVEELQKYKAGSPEYNRLEGQIAKRRSEMSVEAQMARKNFLQEEAAIYYDIYREIEQQVQYSASQRGSVVVLRFNGGGVDADNPEDVLRFINKPVVWHNGAVDITDEVLNTLNHRSGSGDYVPRMGNQGVPYQQRH